MAESKLAQDLRENFLQCAICMEGFKSPRMLPCLHSFCLQCLQQLYDSLVPQPLACPTCRTDVTLPPNGIADLPNNFLLVSLMEKVSLSRAESTSPKCHFCETKDGNLLCLSCKFHMCAKCKEIHDKIPDTDDHTVIPIEKLKDTDYMKRLLASQVPRCSQHEQKYLRFYCTMCSTLVCTDCAIINHRGHECIEAEKRLEKARQNFNSALDISKTHIEVIDGLTAELLTAKDCVKQQVSVARQIIASEYDRFVRRLEHDRKQLLQKLKEIEKEECLLLKKSQEKTASWMKRMENTQAMSKLILEEDNQWEILTMEMSILNEFEKLRADMQDYIKSFPKAKEHVNIVEVGVPVSIDTRSATFNKMPFPLSENMLGEIRHRVSLLGKLVKIMSKKELIYEFQYK